jgi:hypothetical protein
MQMLRGFTSWPQGRGRGRNLDRKVTLATVLQAVGHDQLLTYMAMVYTRLLLFDVEG